MSAGGKRAPNAATSTAPFVRNTSRVPPLVNIVAEFAAKNVTTLHGSRLWPVVLQGPETHALLLQAARRFNVFSQETINSFFATAPESASPAQSPAKSAAPSPAPRGLPKKAMTTKPVKPAKASAVPKGANVNPFALLDDDYSDPEPPEQPEPAKVIKSPRLDSPVEAIGHITRLDLAGLAHVPLAQLHPIISLYLPQLRELDVSEVSAVDLSTAQLFRAASLESKKFLPLEKLIVTGCVAVTDAWLETALPFLPSLTTLILGHTKEEARSQATMHLIWEEQRCVRSPLDDEHTFPSSPTVTDRALTSIATHCRSLRALNISCLREFSSPGMLAALTTNGFATQLINLSMAHNSHDKNNRLTYCGVEHVAKLCTNLEALDFTASFVRTEDGDDDTSRNDGPLLASKLLAANCPRLRELRQQYSESARQAVFEPFSKPNQFSSLQVHSCDKFAEFIERNSESLERLWVTIPYFGEGNSFFHVPNLTTCITTTYFEPDVILTLLKSAPRLEKLRIGCEDGPALWDALAALAPTDTKFSAMKRFILFDYRTGHKARYDTLGPLFPNIQKFCIGNSSFITAWKKVTGGELEGRFRQFLQDCPQLRQVIFPYSIDSGKQLDILDSMIDVEEIRLSCSWEGLLAFLGTRRRWYSRIRKLFLNIHHAPWGEDVPLSRAVNAALKIPAPGELNPHRLACLFPSVKSLEFAPVAEVRDSWWTTLGRKCFANASRLRLWGELGNTITDQVLPIDNSPELHTERAILVLTTVMKRLRQVKVENGWKSVFLCRGQQEPPKSYFPKKRAFLAELRKRGVQFEHSIGLWDRYSPGGGYGSIPDPEADPHCAVMRSV